MRFQCRCPIFLNVHCRRLQTGVPTLNTYILCQRPLSPVTNRRTRASLNTLSKHGTLHFHHVDLGSRAVVVSEHLYLHGYSFAYFFDMAYYADLSAGMFAQRA